MLQPGAISIMKIIVLLDARRARADVCPLALNGPGRLAGRSLPKGFHRIRHYGLFANTNRAEKHRGSPRASQRGPACRRSARAAGYRRGRATCAALPLPVLQWPHDRDRDLRARLRAALAPDAEQDRLIMSQTSRKPRHFPVPMRWPRAGNDPARPRHRAQRTVRPLISYNRLPRRLSDAPSSPACRSPTAFCQHHIDPPSSARIKSP
jgi:hypothetical protein